MSVFCEFYWIQKMESPPIEFVMTFQGHGYSGIKMAPDLNSTLFSMKAGVSINELL